ncbi:MAG TPA: tetratricopeptide repeat protein [Vicinamibacterales bacterium]
MISIPAPRSGSAHGVRRRLVAFGCSILSLGLTAPLTAQPRVERARSSVVRVFALDGVGNRVASGIGVFTDIGRLLVPARLLRGARQASVLYAGREQRVTAVLAEDPRAGLILVAVDLPDGAPPALSPRATRNGRADGRLAALDLEAPPREVVVQAVVDLPGIGPVHRVTGSLDGAAGGSPVVDTEGRLVGVLATREVEHDAFCFLVASERLARMSSVGPLTLPEWSGASIRTDPTEHQRLFQQGLRAALEGRHQDARDVFIRAVALDPVDGDAWAALAACHREDGHRELALAAWRKASEAQPHNARFHHELAVELVDAARLADAALEFREVVRTRPGDAESQFNLGNVYGRLGRYEDEYAAYQATLRLNQAHVGALKNLGIACVALGRYDEAVDAFARAERLVPTDPDVPASLGVAYFDLKDYTSAVAALKRALALAPNLVKAHFGLGVAYAASGERDLARAECGRLKLIDAPKGDRLCRIVDGM